MHDNLKVSSDCSRHYNITEGKWVHLNGMMQGHMWILRRVERGSKRKVDVNEVTGSLY